MTNITILVALIVSVILHEACHALALRGVGIPIKGFQIGTPVIYRGNIFSLGLIPFFGGVQADLTNLSTIRQKWYYAAGPAGSILLGFALMSVGIWLNSYILKLLGIVSLAFGAFNLIPVPPMDGYKLLTLGRQVPYQVQVVWAAIGWTLIAMGTLLWSQ
jgi:Zn-dependent protease